MGITNSALEAIALAAKGDKAAAVAAVRKVRDHALALRETARDALTEATKKCREKETEVAQLRLQVGNCFCDVEYLCLGTFFGVVFVLSWMW